MQVWTRQQRPLWTKCNAPSVLSNLCPTLRFNGGLMYTFARQTKKRVLQAIPRHRFRWGIRFAEARQKLAFSNRVFDHPFYGCWCRDHCAHSGGLHSYLEHYTRAIDFVRPKKVLEWGPGQNTTIAISAGASVVSIEPDERWLLPGQERHAQLVIAVDDPTYIKPEGHWDSDFYFVDSRRRSECIRSVHRNAEKTDHVLCLHDAQRRRYHAALRVYRYVRYLDVGTAVASDSDRILTL